MQGVEAVVGEACVAHHEQALGEERHLGPHVVGGQRPFVVGQLAIDLVDVERADEVDVALRRNAQLALLDVQGGVLEDVYLASGWIF